MTAPTAEVPQELELVWVDPVGAKTMAGLLIPGGPLDRGRERQRYREVLNESAETISRIANHPNATVAAPTDDSTDDTSAVTVVYTHVSILVGVAWGVPTDRTRPD